MTTQALVEIEPYDPASPEGRAAAAALTRVLDDVELAMRARGAWPISSPALTEVRVPGAGPGRSGTGCDGGRLPRNPRSPQPTAVALSIAGGSL